jgi:Peptidase family S41/Tricorn protease C1 domain
VANIQGETTMSLCRHLVSVLFLGLILYGAAFGEPVDLGKRYPATIDFSEQSKGLDYTCGPEDIWLLKEFNYSMGDNFDVRLGPSLVIFGKHGTNALWAVVFPDEPGQIVAAKQGKGSHITSIWLRFNPARIAELFPAETVLGQGDAVKTAPASRIAAYKMTACWQSGGLPMVPMKESLTFDMETREGKRWFVSLNTNKKKVEAFESLNSMPEAKPVDEKTALEVFDAVWNAFDREYAMFVIKPKVDWDKLRETYRPRAAAAKNNNDLGSVIAEMLDHLEDLHVYVKVDGQYMPGFNRPRMLNASQKACEKLIGDITFTDHSLGWGKTEDGIGYISVNKLTDEAMPDDFDEVLEKMEDTKGLIIDLRYNGGGGEPLGQQVAGRFLDRPRVYSLSQYRNGPKHTDLTEKKERTCEPAGPWSYVGPVAVLQGQKTMSSAESFALMLAQCPQVITIGDRTAGSSGNPRQIQAGAGIVVNLPRWIDLDPDGKPIDFVGISPQIKIDAKPEDFSGQRDPVLSAALENLRNRSKTDQGKKKVLLKSTNSSAATE